MVLIDLNELPLHQSSHTSDTTMLQRTGQHGKNVMLAMINK